MVVGVGVGVVRARPAGSSQRATARQLVKASSRRTECCSPRQQPAPARHALQEVKDSSPAAAGRGGLHQRIRVHSLHRLMKGSKPARAAKMLRLTGTLAPVLCERVHLAHNSN